MAGVVKEMDGAPYVSLIAWGCNLKATLVLLEPDFDRRVATA